MRVVIGGGGWGWGVVNGSVVNCRVSDPFAFILALGGN